MDVLPDLSFHVIGVSHHTADVEVRERFALSPAELDDLLRAEHASGRSALLLSTCNRCEFFWSGDDDREPWFREFARSRGVPADAPLTRFDGAGAVRHLFTVAAGLDSQILGEAEILGQIRRAYDRARSAGVTTREIQTVFSSALAAGRRVRRETMLGRHPASVSSAAIDLVANGWERPATQYRAVVVGAGEVAEGVLRSLHERGVTQVILVNRRRERARSLARTWGIEFRTWEELPELLVWADLLVVATAAAGPVVSRQQISEALGVRDQRRLVVLDLGVPRNVEPGTRGLPLVRLLDLDDLQQLCCPAVGLTSPALAEAERVILEELGRLDQSLRARNAAPQLAELHRQADEMAQQEATWALAQLRSLSSQEQDVVRKMADRLVRRVLYPVSRSVREAS